MLTPEGQSALDWVMKQAGTNTSTGTPTTIMKAALGDPTNKISISPETIAALLVRYHKAMTPQTEVNISGRKFKET